MCAFIRCLLIRTEPRTVLFHTKVECHLRLESGSRAQPTADRQRHRRRPSYRRAASRGLTMQEPRSRQCRSRLAWVRFGIGICGRPLARNHCSSSTARGEDLPLTHARVSLVGEGTRVRRREGAGSRGTAWVVELVMELVIGSILCKKRFEAVKTVAPESAVGGRRAENVHGGQRIGLSAIVRFAPLAAMPYRLARLRTVRCLETAGCDTPAWR